MELSNILVSLLGGGFAGTILTLIINYFSEKTQRKIMYIQEQLNNFYGPLHFIVLKNEKLFELNKRIMNAYDKEYVGKQWSQSESTQNGLDKETKDTIAMANEYIKQVKENNNKIIDIIDKNYSYADFKDNEILILFYEDYIRINKEIENELLILPRKIYFIVGEISFMRPEIISSIKKIYKRKKNELNKLIN
jgi:hypothetical protein